jgi:hypothetical protein
MSIQIGKPYKIIAKREKRYSAHYNIPSAECVVIPLKAIGAEVLCDVRWEDVNGEMQVIHNKMFIADNLKPLNEMIHEKVYEIWTHYYSNSSNVVSPANPEQ